MTNLTPQSLVAPELIDKALASLLPDIEARLTWLTKAYSKATRLKKEIDGRAYYFPAIYASKGFYIDLLPDMYLGNYSFFITDDLQELEPGKAGTLISSRGAFILFCDIRTVYPGDYEERSIENLKADILKALRAAKKPNVRLNLVSIEERVENIFRGFTVDRLDSALLLFPYMCIRVNLEIKFSELC